MPIVVADPWFWAAAIPAVILVGLSKGGLGGAAGFLGVPMMALTVSPLQAAAILLPILIVMDLVSLWTWRGWHDRALLWQTLPGSLLGIGIGWATASMVSADMVRLLLGVVAIVFVARWLAGLAKGGPVKPTSPDARRGAFWGTVAGFTSFVAHAGGPPFQVYMLPLRLDPRVFTGTGVVFFAVTNMVKLGPYLALGQFDGVNIATSLALMPLAPLATLAGAWVVKRMRPGLFYPLTYVTMSLVALKLVWDGLVAVTA